MRNNFIKTLVELAEKDEKVMLLTGDLGYAVLEPFKDKFPSRFINVGVAEQNMAGVAAGLALEGATVFLYSIGNFPTLRSMEQIRYDICYHNLNVKVIAVGSGYAYGPLGTSHHTTEDLGMLRTIPNLEVAAPGDPHEVKAITKYYTKRSGPGYMRLNKAGEKLIHSNEIELNGSDILPIKTGSRVAVLTTGAILESAFQYIEAEKKDWSLYSIPFLSNINKDEILKIAQKYEHIITYEEHQLNSGFGSTILEVVSDLYARDLIKKFPKVHRIGIPNIFIPYAGTQEYLRDKAGLSLNSIKLEHL